MKNIGDTDVSGYLRLYRSPSTCFMQPGLWKDNVLSSPKFENGASLPYTRFHAKAGKVTACEYPLILDGKASNNFCIVGIVGGLEAAIPENFPNYDEFLEWVHRNRTVAIRNLNVLTCSEVSDYEGSYLFSNPESYESPCFIDVVHDKVPVGINVNVAS